jgi:hypothetical protein
MLLIIILITLLKRVVGVVRVAKVVIVYVPRSNKGHLPIIKTYLLAPLLLLILTLNTRKLTSKRYLLYSPLALYSRSLPSSIVLNYRIIRLAVIPIIRRIVIVIASLITRATF